jgi:hypothetical protein
LFAFRIRRGPHGEEILEGASQRYTAIVLIGLSSEDPQVAAQILAGESIHALVQRLLAQVDGMDNLGDVALTLWAAKSCSEPDAERAATRLRALRPTEVPYPTVELAWALTALCSGKMDEQDLEWAHSLYLRLLSTQDQRSGLFAHLPPDTRALPLRAHVACFADLVYPIQALSYYSLATGEREALEAAKRCAWCICDLQGPAGQWWWHYDVRTGRVIEGYPVYSVHQDAMAPMALFALRDASGMMSQHAIERGVRWLLDPPEVQAPLIDRGADLIWRKVARREPLKLARGLQAVASGLHAKLRVPGIDALLPPDRIDYECRPYHLGWLLHAWNPERLSQARDLSLV